MADARAPLGYELVRHDPLVVLATTGHRRHLEQLAAQLARDFAGTRFVGVMSAEEIDDIDAPLTVLAPALAEVIFTATSSRRGVAGTDLAMRALDVVGMGQDFVFTVAELSGAIGYGVDELTTGHPGAWDGTGLLVLCSPADVDDTRRLCGGE